MMITSGVLMNSDTLIRFLFATAVIVIIPGPNIMLITNDCIRYGFKKSVLTVTGINAGMILLFSLSLAGISTLLVRFSWLFDFIRIAGVLYLLYLGITQIFDSLKNDTQPHRTLPLKNNFFIKGFLISVTNPKGLFFAGAFFPQFLDKDAAMIPQVVILCSGCIFVASFIGFLYAFFAGTANALFKSEKFQKRASFVSGIVLILFGAGLFFTNQTDMI